MFCFVLLFHLGAVRMEKNTVERTFSSLNEMVGYLCVLAGVGLNVCECVGEAETYPGIEVFPGQIYMTKISVDLCVCSGWGWRCKFYFIRN